jgi:nucleoid DNA-binding protein
MAKKSKAKLPKTVAGVKVPKAVRTSSLLDNLLNSPLGREILAEAIVAAAGAAASVLMKKRPSADQVTQAGEAIVDTGSEAASVTKDLAQTAVGAVTEVVADAAQRILPGSLTGFARNPTTSRARRVARRGQQSDEES